MSNDIKDGEDIQEPDRKRVTLNTKQGLKEKIETHIKTKKGKGYDNNQDMFRQYLENNLEVRRQKLKLQELKVKSRVAISGATTDEDRAHQLKMQEIKLKYELEKERMRMQIQKEALKLRQIKARNGLRGMSYSDRSQVSCSPERDIRRHRHHSDDEDPYLGPSSSMYSN